MDVKNSRNDGEVEERPNMAADLGSSYIWEDLLQRTRDAQETSNEEALWHAQCLAN